MGAAIYGVHRNTVKRLRPCRFPGAAVKTQGHLGKARAILDMGDIFWLIDTVIGIYIFIMIVWVVMSWLVNFGIVNPRNQFVYSVLVSLDRLVEPTLRPIRRVLPDLGGLDLSPLIMLLLLSFLRRVMWSNFGPY